VPATTQPSPAAWVALRVDLPAELEEPVASFLLDAGASGLVTEAEVAGRRCVEAPFPACDETEVTSRLARYLTSLAEIEPAALAVTVAVAPVPAVDWVGVARRHHRPLAVGRRLLIAPPWDVPAPGDRELIVIEPGMAFGTGQHATTRGCLLAIEEVLGTGRRVGTALDLGTGSGLLAIALARLGVEWVVALDADAAVLAPARGNLARNGAGRVRLAGGTAACLRARFDLVVANLLADTIVAEAPALAAVVTPGGRLILSGLRTEQTPAVRAAYPGWATAAIRTEDGWDTLTLARGRRD